METPRCGSVRLDQFRADSNVIKSTPIQRAKIWLDTHGNDLHRYGIQD